VPREEAQAYATEAGLLFFETSAKTGEGIVEIFTEIGMPLALNVELLLKITSSEENTYRAYTGFVARWRR
jgi:Ras-related protein Rab-5C/Rab family protein